MRLTSSLSFVLVLAVIGLLGVPRAHGQAPTAMSVDNSSASPVLKAFGDGGLLAPAQSATAGDIPATGAGSRLMWYPGKYAFRVGQVTGSQWDDSNVGEGSVAFGRDTQAGGNRAMAMNNGTTASGGDATAMGEGTTASGPESTAMGFQTEASAGASTALGSGTIAGTPSSLSVGQFNATNQSSDGTLFVAGNGSSGSRSDALVLDKDAGLVVGGALNTGVIPASGAGTRMMWYPNKAAFRAGRVFDNTFAGGVNGTTYWDDSNVGRYSVAMGVNTRAIGRRAVAMGDATTASDRAAVAMGTGATASQTAAVAMGIGTQASGTGAVAMVQNAVASGSRSVAMGNNANATGLSSTAMGTYTEAASENSMSIGQCNSANTTADGTLFVVGNGPRTGTCDSRSDAFRVDPDGSAHAVSHDALSDRRLKSDIVPIETSVLEQLEEIRPVRYHFRDTTGRPSGRQLGLIAQDVRKEFPALVSKGADGMLSLAYPKFTAVLLKGLQEQQAQIERQEARIDSLERETQRLDRIEKRLARLEAQDRSVSAGIPMTELLLGILVGGLLGAGLVWRRRH